MYQRIGLWLQDDTRFALSLPLRGPLPFTCHGRQAVPEATAPFVLNINNGFVSEAVKGMVTDDYVVQQVYVAG